MPPEHAGTGVTHHHFHLLPPRALIAVDRAIGARGFFGSKPAAFQSQSGIIQQLLAFRAEAGRWIVPATAITMDHRLDRFPFAGEPFVGETGGQGFDRDRWHHCRRNVLQSHLHNVIVAKGPAGGFDFGQGFDESPSGAIAMGSARAARTIFRALAETLCVRRISNIPARESRRRAGCEARPATPEAGVLPGICLIQVKDAAGEPSQNAA